MRKIKDIERASVSMERIVLRNSAKAATIGRHERIMTTGRAVWRGAFGSWRSVRLANLLDSA
jgi:hypothetical protein